MVDALLLLSVLFPSDESSERSDMKDTLNDLPRPNKLGFFALAALGSAGSTSSSAASALSSSRVVLVSIIFLIMCKDPRSLFSSKTPSIFACLIIASSSRWKATTFAVALKKTRTTHATRKALMLRE